jgi:hypothetical protein
MLKVPKQLLKNVLSFHFFKFLFHFCKVFNLKNSGYFNWYDQLFHGGAIAPGLCPGAIGVNPIFKIRINLSKNDDQVLKICSNFGSVSWTKLLSVLSGGADRPRSDARRQRFVR